MASDRTLADVRDWLKERRASEVSDAPTDQSTAAYSMTLGAIETIDALTAYLDGDDDA